MILAGGAGSRMGRDKLVLEVGGVPLIRRVHDVLASRCEEVLVAGAERMPVIPGAHCVPDRRPGRKGPLAGIEAGLAAARHRCVFVAAGDMPLLSEELVEFLLERLAGRGLRAVVPRYGEPHPLCAAYDREILSEVRAALDGGMRAVKEFLKGLEGVEYVERELCRFGDPDLILMNVNSPDDLNWARTALRKL